MKALNYCFFIGLCSAFCLPASAQKLPEVQEESIWSAAPVKIDGKLAGDAAFAAYNKRTLLSYSLSNDANNLYLVMSSADAAGSSKIMAGGITFTVNTSGKKKEKDAYAVTFPYVKRPERGQRGVGGQGRMGPQGIRQGQQNQALDSAAITERRKQQLSQFKEIKVGGFPEITDSLVSVFNEYGIKAGINYDKENNLVYELAIPLKLLSLDPAKGQEFSYNIKVNGRSFSAGAGFGGRGAGGFGGMNGGGGNNNVVVRQGFDPSMLEPVDFWAKYALVSK